MERKRQTSKDLQGKMVLTKSGKTLGRVGDLVFEVGTGELLHMILMSPTGYATSMDLELDKDGRQMVPFSSVLSVEDFVIVNEEDII